MPGISPSGSIALIKRLLSETGRAYAGQYVIAFIFMTMVAASMGLSAWLMGDVVDGIFVEQNEHLLFYLSGSILVISLCRGIGAYGATVTLAIKLEDGDTVTFRVNVQGR